MKKTFLFLLLVIPLGVHCQYSRFYYHRVGDTIEHDSPTYFHLWWDWQYYLTTKRELYFHAKDAADPNAYIDMQRHFTPDTLKIVGIAGLRPNPPSRLDSSLHERLVIYRNGTIDKAADIQRYWWRDKHRTIHIVTNADHMEGLSVRPPIDPATRITDCCYNWPLDGYFGVFEYYFDTAIYVVDSFYVGHTVSSRTYYEVYEPFGRSDFDCEGNPCPLSPAPTYTNHILQTNTYEHFGWYNWDRATLVWPIIQIDTTVPPEGVCLPLENLRATAIDSFSVSIAWTDVSTVTSQVEIRYGPTATPNANWRTTTVSATTTATIDLPRRDYSDYAIFIRAICQSTKNNSEWSDSLFVSLPRNTPDNPSPTDSLDIHLPSSGNTSITLQPNPATGHTLITSPLPLQHVTLHNTSGALLYSNPAHGLSHALPLDGLPAGSYLVSVRTARGTFVRTLVVK